MKLCHTGDGFWNEGTGRLQTGGVLRQQSLGDQPQAKRSCKTSAAMTRVTLRANAKEDDRRRMTAPEALPCLHRSYCLVIATFRVWQRLWRHFWTHERSLSLNVFVLGCPASLLRLLSSCGPSLAGGARTLGRGSVAAAPQQVGSSQTRWSLCPLPFGRQILNHWTTRVPTMKVSFINLIHKLFTKPDFLRILFTLSTNCKLGPLTQVIFTLSWFSIMEFLF